MQELRRLRLEPSKSQGQSFIVSQKVCLRLTEALNTPNLPAKIMEIGPGLGAITDILLKRAKSLYIVEISPGFCRFLETAYKGTYPVFPLQPRHLRHLGGIPEKEGLTVIEGDVLALPWPQVDCLISNLPFQISAEFFIRWITEGSPSTGAFILQREFVYHLTAKPNGPHYTMISVLASLFLDIEVLSDIEKHAFFPAIEVQAQIVRCTWKKMENEFMAAVFSHRTRLIPFLRLLFEHKKRHLKNAIALIQQEHPPVMDEYPGLKMLAESPGFFHRSPFELDGKELFELFQLALNHPKTTDPEEKNEA